MSFVPRLSENSPTPMRNNLWWYSSGNPYYAGGVGLPNCTCYAYGRYAEVRGSFNTELGNISGRYGDAKEWYPDYPGQKGQEPALGAVMCWYREGRGGHVAVVEEIYSNGDVLTSNSAYNGTYFYTQVIRKSAGYTWSSLYQFQGFIYNTGYAPQPGLGVSPEVVAAITGNFRAESTINPGVWESLIPCAWDFQYDYTNKGGYGLGQWTNVGTPHGRTWNLHEYVTSHGYADGDGNGQLAFLIAENYWVNSPRKIGPYTSMMEFLQTSITDIETLTLDWFHCWEGIDNGTSALRVEAAQRNYEFILAHMNDDPSQYQWVSSNSYLSIYGDDYFNNVMCIYFWFLGNGPTPYRRRRRMPIYMMLRYY